MTKLGTILSAMALLTVPILAYAGVVVDEQQVIDQANGNKVTRNRTVMIQGDKQKSIIDNGSRTVITDLAKGSMTMVDSTRKTFLEFPFPPKAGAMAGMSGGVLPTITFKKTGRHEKVIGYSCEMYAGSGTVGGNAVSMTGCFSDSAPGAEDYSAFQRKMAEKVKGTSMANMGQIPQGVPLRLSINTTLSKPRTAGMSPEQAAKVNQLLAGRQFVTNTTVTRIETKALPADSFRVPAGYHEQQLPALLGGRDAPMAPAPRKVPE